MADNEGENGESDPGSIDNGQPSIHSEKEADTSFVDIPHQNQLELWNPDNTSPIGPRSLFLRRSENGFGFTLRHFIVYPPESNAILARDQRLGIDTQTIGNEPMDTIFVKNVRDNSPASVAGLKTGDRIISVNGEDIAGLSYAKIIHLIHKTGNYLHLLVVPKENDILQLYFSETAHNPETNQRLRVHSPEMTNNLYAKKNCLNPVKPTNMHHYTKSETSPILQIISSSTDDDRIASHVRTVGTRRCSEGNNERRLESFAGMNSRIRRDLYSSHLVSDTSSCGSSESGPTYGFGVITPTYRSSLDAGIGRGNNYDSLSDSSVKDPYGSEDSLIMSRLRKSFEQKEEFMNRLPQSENGNTRENVASNKEFYSRPQKLCVPVWPPLQTSSSESRMSESPNIVPDPNTKVRNKQNFVSSLDKIQENSSPLSRSTVDPVTYPFQMVSVRMKQFENGPVDDKTELYRSELARLSTKHNVANVAARKRDFETRAHTERQIFATRETRSLENANIPFHSTFGSGNRIIPIGSKNLHCLPPADFMTESKEDNDVRNDDLLLQKSKPVVRQDSYLAACNKPTITITRKVDENTTIKNEENEGLSGDQLAIIEDDKSTRRISYIKATGGDSMNIDSECECSDSELVTTVAPQRRAPKKWRTPLFPGEIQRLRRFFEDLAASSSERGILGSRKTTGSFPDQDQHSVNKEGAVLCKVTQVDGKRAADRSWKPAWLILKGPFLCLYKDKREPLLVHETPATFDRADLGASCDRIDIRCSLVEVACDYTKRKHVFRLNAPSVGAELLLQADDATSMNQWVKVLQDQALLPSTLNDHMTSIAPNVSPNVGNKTLRKITTSLRNRSPTNDPQNIKTKKPALPDSQQTSPKSRTWKNKMVKHIRRIQPGSSSPNTNVAINYPSGVTIGIPLEICPSSTFSEYVPLLVEICTNIVEAKGLEIIGIYRVPGNTAAVTSLTEAVNRGLDITALDQDPRWSDVNVISSLLKSFFRKLPDALLTSELYPHFIKADRISDPVIRLTTIQKLVHDLPDHNFETLRYLLLHLKQVVAKSSINKMEARNLAIVFGPTLVRNGDDMVTMVTDMSHQCRIVESLLCHVDWCFGDGSVEDLKASNPEINSIPELDATSSNPSLLLENIRKVEGNMQSPVTAKDIMSTIIGAANRKMQKTSKTSYSNRKIVPQNTNITSVSNNSDCVSESQNQASSKVGVIDKKHDEKRVLNQLDKESKVLNESVNSVTNVKSVPENTSVATSISSSDANTWTYASLSASTQERIRRFEQETKAMLQRELTRQKRMSDFTYDEVGKEKTVTKTKESSEKQQEPSLLSPLSDSTLDTGRSEETLISISHSVCDNPPPVIVMRRNLPSINGKNVTINNDDSDNINNNNNLKRLKTEEEFLQNKSLARSGSLDSLNRVGRPSSHVSDDGSDLLMSLTNTFDRKLKSLSEVKNKQLVSDECTLGKKRNSFSGQLTEESSLFRDPSLHRMSEKFSKTIEVQNHKVETNKENKELEEKTDAENEKEVLACVTCGCTLKHSEAVQQNCDNWKRSVLQETQLENRLQENIKREPKLFHSNSVKLRRSESLKEDSTGIKLRRSGSLNKHEPKISRLESWMLTKNAEAIKLKRSDSLTKSEKTETNLLKRRQMELDKKLRAEKDGKLKRRNGIKSGSIKRRHTVGGTKDFDKISWLQNQQREMNKENKKERRTSSPDLSSTRMTDFFIEVVVRPRSFISADPNFISRLLNIPLESHV